MQGAWQRQGYWVRPQALARSNRNRATPQAPGVQGAPSQPQSQQQQYHYVWQGTALPNWQGVGGAWSLQPVPSTSPMLGPAPLHPVLSFPQPPQPHPLPLQQQQQSTSQPPPPPATPTPEASVETAALVVDATRRPHVPAFESTVHSVEVCNVVCHFSMPLHVDLHTMARTATNVVLHQGSTQLMKQLRKPSCYIKVYNSGKVYIVGCKSEEEAHRAARIVARKIQKAMRLEHKTLRPKHYRVSNILATYSLPFGVLLHELVRKYPKEAYMEPELTVGLIWRSFEPRATLRIYTTGSVSVTGATTRKAVVEVLAAIYPICAEFRCSLRQPATPTGKRNALKRKRPDPFAEEFDRQKRQFEEQVIEPV